MTLLKDGAAYGETDPFRNEAWIGINKNIAADSTLESNVLVATD